VLRQARPRRQLHLEAVLLHGGGHEVAEQVVLGAGVVPPGRDEVAETELQWHSPVAAHGRLGDEFHQENADSRAFVGVPGSAQRDDRARIDDAPRPLDQASVSLLDHEGLAYLEANPRLESRGNGFSPIAT
jgi:hypothetical protein